MIILVLFGGFCLVCVVGGIVQYIKNPKPPKRLTFTEYQSYYRNKEWLHEDEDETEDAPKAERITLLDETIVKYTRLLDTLTAQYNNTWNEAEKAKILSKQISTMEKLNRALEKRERLE